MSCGSTNSIDVSLSGPLGPDGVMGAQGLQGPPGIQGYAGNRGRDGHSGTYGFPGPQGIQGPQGRGGKSSVVAYLEGGEYDAFTRSVRFGNPNLPAGEYLFHTDLRVQWGGMSDYVGPDNVVTPIENKRMCDFCFQEMYGNTVTRIPYCSAYRCIPTRSEIFPGPTYGPWLYLNVLTEAGFSHYFKATVYGNQEWCMTAEEIATPVLWTGSYTNAGSTMTIYVYALQGVSVGNAQYKVTWRWAPASGAEGTANGSVYFAGTKVVSVIGAATGGAWISNAIAPGTPISWAPFIEGTGTPSPVTATAAPVVYPFTYDHSLIPAFKANLTVYNLPQYVI